MAPDYGEGRTKFGHIGAKCEDLGFQKHMLEIIAWSLGLFDAPAAPNPKV